MPEKTVTIVGGGFAAHSAIKYLLKQKITTTLISQEQYFLFTPLLPEIVSGVIPEKIATFYWEEIKDKNFTFINDKIENFDLEKQTLSGQKQHYSYKNLLITTGGSPNFYNIFGTENAHTLKTLPDAIKLKRELSKINSNIKNITIIGSGATGVEIAGEIIDLSKKNKVEKITIVNAGDKILSQFTEKMSKRAEGIFKQNKVELKNNFVVSNITKNTIQSNRGETLTADLIILTTGIKTSIKSIAQVETTDENGYLKTNAFLQSKIYPNVFAAGDVMSIEDTKIPKLAQIATRAGKIAAINIKKYIEEKPPKPFKYNIKGNLVSLGPKKAVGEIKGLNIAGWWVWVMWRLVHGAALPRLKDRFWLWINTIGKLF